MTPQPVRAMAPAVYRNTPARKLPTAVLFALTTPLIFFAACGTPGAPQPPSLKLPARVSDLVAVRTGSTVALHWTMPKKTTDHLLLREPVHARVCRSEASSTANSQCQPAGEAAPGAEADFRDPLPASFQSGPARQLSYFIELPNRHNRSAGPSNAAIILAGAAPAPVVSLAAEPRKDGVALHWAKEDEANTAVRLHRKLLNPKPSPTKNRANKPKPASAEPQSNLFKRPAEATEVDLLVESPATLKGNPLQSATLDKTARFGDIYEYTAQRVERLTVATKSGAQTLELPGEVSPPVRVDVLDTFPPAIPTGLVAVAVAEEKAIDLSWQPDTDEDLAGYIVYRISVSGEASSSWQRVSGDQPIPTPAWRDPSVEPGHSYRYAVTAIDLTGHESKRSIETEESVPAS